MENDKAKTRKRGQIKLEGSNPMAFVESDQESPYEWTIEQENLAKVVSQTVKSYVTALETLANGKYAHLKEKIPEYIAKPGNFFS